MFKHILIATDGSEQAGKAVDLALEIGGQARLTALMVVADYDTIDLAWATFTNGPRPEGLRDRLQAAGRERLDAALQGHGARSGRIEKQVVVGDPVHEQILETARREGCDLIVMAPRGRGLMASALLGSVTARVISLSTVPVLVAP